MKQLSGIKQFEVYDDFDKRGYPLADYAEKWSTPYGLGEMALKDTRNFDGGRFNLSAAPFLTHFYGRPDICRTVSQPPEKALGIATVFTTPPSSAIFKCGGTHDDE